MIFWVNVHGAFVLGMILIGIFFVGESIRTYLKHPSHLTWTKNGWLALTGLITLLATLVNPRISNIWVYAYEMSTSSDIQDLNLEWQPPVINGGFSETLLFVTILALLVLLIYSRYRPTVTEVLLISFFIWLAWSATRHVVWYGIVATPILVRVIQAIPIKSAKFSTQRNWLNLAIILILFMPVILVQPWLIEDFPLPDSYWEAVYKGEDIGPLVETTEPLKAIEYLREHPGGNLFHSAGYASYMIWTLPAQGVFIDGRVELFSREHWDDYYNISDSIHYTERLSKYKVDRLMLDLKEQANLVQALKGDQTWITEYQDENTIILTK